MARDEVDHRDSQTRQSASPAASQSASRAASGGIGANGGENAEPSQLDGHESHEPIASDARRDPLIGTRVNGKFHIHSAIARGGMGRVYYATQMPLDRPVALKVVEAEGDDAHDTSFFKRFLREASILAKLQHPNVVTLHDYGEIEGSAPERYFIAMEYLAGETLAERLANRLQLGVAETVLMSRQILRGLREAHTRGVVHRDLKPSNIILVPDHEGGEIVKLVDFGIGKVMDGKPSELPDLTQSGAFMGTPRYMAPEQFEGNATPASDLYALGTILYQALSGELPFRGATMTEFMVAKLMPKPIPTIRDMFPMSDVTAQFETLIRLMLSHAPADRPSTEEATMALAACEDEIFGAPRTARTTGSFSSRSGMKGAPRVVAPPTLDEHPRPGAAGPTNRLRQPSSTNETLRSEESASWRRDLEKAPSTSTGPNVLTEPTAVSAGSPARSAPDPASSRQPRLPDRTPDPHLTGFVPEFTAPTPAEEPSRADPREAPNTTPSPSAPAPPPSVATPAPPRRSNTPLIFAAAIAVAGVAFGLISRNGSGVTDRPVASADVPSAIVAASADKAPATASAQTNTTKLGRGTEHSFTLTIDSSPIGATVLEGENIVGFTPLQFTIDRASVKDRPRTFAIAKDGYVTTNVVQGPSDENVRTVVALASDPRPKATARPTGTPAVDRPRSGDAGEIRLER